MPTATVRESAAKPSRDRVLSFGRTAGLLDFIARLPIGNGSSSLDGIASTFESRPGTISSFERENGMFLEVRNSAELRVQQNKA
jgi:hypothetical protein